ncbi:hypothetical protein [Xanthocytophaga agilis]|uniref:Lipoprotein n=1 Tax=Xanthocytophaga agilis TaxID=3048010 RepID=A0AAE3UEE8_9BACT|nr:hypothetical protein [Xanthocytophaga agilis]MDJ1499473.1 hypothetical protein [Xanthocytophaga agilis]
MKPYSIFLVILFTFASCDCLQRANGVVLDRQTKLPVYNTVVAQTEKPDVNDPEKGRSYTDTSGTFE